MQFFASDKRYVKGRKEVRVCTSPWVKERVKVYMQDLAHLYKQNWTLKRCTLLDGPDEFQPSETTTAG
jgi:hypothetical protein